MINLIVRQNNRELQRHEFDTDEISIGRIARNDVVINSELVSKCHAQIIRRKSGLFILDLGSTNGTLVKGVRIPSRQMMPLELLDVVTIGEFDISIKEIPDTTKKQNAAEENSEACPNAILVEDTTGLHNLSQTPSARPPSSANQRLLSRYPTKSSIRRLIGQLLRNDSDFDAFCLDYFPSIKKKFSAAMDRVAKINILLEGVDEVVILQYLHAEFPDIMEP